MKRFSTTILSSLAGALMLSACGAGSENSPDTQMEPAAPAPEPKASATDTAPANEKQEACPLALAGVTSSAENTVDGVVVVFATTKKGDLPELRNRVDRLAAMHGTMHASPPQDVAAAPPQAPGPSTTAEGAAEATKAGGKLDAKVTVESGEEDVRLVFRPADPAQLDSTRDQLRKQADDLVQEVCDQAGRKGLR